MEYGWMLLRMLAVLAAVCGLAYVMLRWGLRRLAPFDPDQTGRLEVIEQLAVGPKRTIMVVRAGDEILLVGSSEAGLQSLGRLDRDNWCNVASTSAQESMPEHNQKEPHRSTSPVE